jgi:hypothetical protein
MNKHAGEVICFHNPDEENGYLSNWYLSDFKAEGILFSSMEQYMMYKKAMTFGNADIAKEILETKDVAKIKALGRQVHNYNETVWNGVRQIVVYNGLLEKFQQNHELKEKLLSTENAVLAECAVKDKIWGIGLSMTNPSRYNMNDWAGNNLLGFALMEVRAALK